MTDTRDAFEAHFQLSQRQAKRDNAGEYIDEKVRDKWEGWQAAMAGAEKDAQRYRWLRREETPSLVFIHPDETGDISEGEMDAAIDAAMQECA